MLKYNITEGNGGRVIVVRCDDLQRYALHDTSDNPLKFQRVNGSAIAVAYGPIKVYKKPSGHDLHHEYMMHNARSLWLGFTPDFTRLVRNLYEFVQLV